MASQEITVIEQGASRAAVGRGGFDGAESVDRETLRWQPRQMGSPDMAINRGNVKPLADARALDLVRNDGPARGSVTTGQDSIVGGHYRLNASPKLVVLQRQSKSFDEVWLKEFQQVVEAYFDLIGETDGCWLDAARMNTFTGLVRLAIAQSMIRGEVLGTAEWIRNQTRRPVSTAIQLISPDRLCNPNGQADTRFLRRGVVRDIRGRPLAYWIRKGLPLEPYADSLGYEWVRVPTETQFGRKQVIHIVDQLEPDQSRGIAAMVSVLKRMRMAKSFSDLALQQMVIQASYAATIESELPPEVVAAMMGQQQGGNGYVGAIGAYLDMLSKYLGGSNNISIDGSKIPHLFPGTTLNTKALGEPGGVGMPFEESMNRHIAAGLGTSYEEYSRDLSKLSYSGLKGSFMLSERALKAKKKGVADRFANAVYALVLEELIQTKNVPLPIGIHPEFFYLPLMKEALCGASWIGAGRGQIDELKETQAAILRIKSGLSTYEKEIARFGDDWREVFAQKAREAGVIEGHALVLSLDSTSGTSGASTQEVASNDTAKPGEGNADPDEDEDL